MVNKEMIIGDLLNMHEGVATVLFKSGMHCVGCPSSIGETLAEASVIHGLDADKIVVEINELLSA